jgi:calcineurin-like phosphoesterase family protein
MNRRRALSTILAGAVAGCGMDRILGPLGKTANLDIGGEGAITLIGAGDVHAAPYKAKIATATAGLIAQYPNDLVFALGDNAGTKGTAAEYAVYHQFWGGFKDRTLFVCGDHEYLSSPVAAGFFDYVNGAAGERGQGWYARTLGAWRVYVLNTFAVATANVTALRAAQTAWLKADLAQYPHLRKLAFQHRPVFASRCTHNNGQLMTAGLKNYLPAWDLLQAHGCEALLVGHVHRYERFARVNRLGVPDEAGMRQFIVGVGGGVKYQVLEKHPASEVQVVEHGVFRIALEPNSYSWQCTDMFGILRDEGSQECKPLPVTVTTG